MNKSVRAAPSAAASATATATASTSHATAGQSNSALASQLAGQQQDASTSILDNMAAEQGRSPRVTGAGADTLVALLGEPPWQVDAFRGDRTLDGMQVLRMERKKGDPPSWYLQAGDARNLGHMDVGNGFTSGGWHVLGSSAGVHHVGFYDSRTQEGTYFVIDYQAPRAKTKEELRDQWLLDENGDMTLQYGLFKGQQFLSGVVNLFNPADNLIQAATGRNLDVFDAENFGKELSLGQRGGQLFQAGIEVANLVSMGGATSLSTGQKVALAATVLADAGGEPLIKSLVEAGILDADSAAFARVALKLVGVSQTFSKYRGGQDLDLSDYLGTLSALWSGGEQAVKELLGDEGYETYWQANAGLISTVFKNADKVAALVETLSN